jgi:hypothetical protein
LLSSDVFPGGCPSGQRERPVKSPAQPTEVRILLLPPTTDRPTDRPFKHGMSPHGGFAIGLERWVAQLTGVSNVREVRAFPRDSTRIDP